MKPEPNPGPVYEEACWEGRIRWMTQQDVDDGLYDDSALPPPRNGQETGRRRSARTKPPVPLPALKDERDTVPTRPSPEKHYSEERHCLYGNNAELKLVTKVSAIDGRQPLYVVHSKDF